MSALDYEIGGQSLEEAVKQERSAVSVWAHRVEKAHKLVNNIDNLIDEKAIPDSYHKQAKAIASATLKNSQEHHYRALTNLARYEGHLKTNAQPQPNET